MKKGISMLLFTVSIFCVLLLLNGCKKSDNHGDPELPTVTDQEGNAYHYITLGTQTWMVENLKVTKYRNGDSIPFVPDSVTWKSTYAGAYCINQTSGSNGSSCGYLYNYFAVSDKRNLCPEGWHIPSDTEWNTLSNYLINNGYGFEGGGDDVGKSLASTTDWDNSKVNGDIGNHQETNNSSRFSAFPAGLRNYSGEYIPIGIVCFFWTSTEMVPGLYGVLRAMKYDGNNIYKSNTVEGCGLSIRAIKDY